MYQVKICVHENKNYTPLKIIPTQCKFENVKVAISTAFSKTATNSRINCRSWPAAPQPNCPLATAIFSALHYHL